MSLADLNDNEDVVLHKSGKKILSKYRIGLPVKYDPINKKISVSYIKTETDVTLGVLIDTEKISNGAIVAHCIYKGYLLKEDIKISSTIQEQYILTYVLKLFNQYKEHIKSLMPREKKLKRLNLRLMNKALTQILYNNLDAIIEGFLTAMDYEYALKLKALIVTTPFYVIDEGKIKVYHFDTNELTDAEYEGANFLCYFSFLIYDYE